jgi:hypothetical protein
MVWVCSKCNKSFRNLNQWHSCSVVSLDDHFIGKAPAVRQIFDHLCVLMNGIGRYEINPVKSSVQFRAGSTFMGVKLKKEFAEVELFLPFVVIEAPVIKSVRISGHRVLHYMIIKDPSDVTDPVKRWIRISYEIVVNEEMKRSKH